MHSIPNPRLVALYQRAVICQAFPAYKLHEVKGLPAREILQAMQLLKLAREAQSSG